MPTARFSIVTPVHDPPEAALRSMLESVTAQTFPDWEHCIVDDGSTKPFVRQMLQAAQERDSRIKLVLRDTAGGIVAASNDALELASGEFVALLDHDDALSADALLLVDAAIRQEPETDYLYTDEDKIDEQGNHFDLFLKPDWSPERMHSQMYTCHFSVLRRALVDAVGRFRKGFDGSQDWDLVLRVTEAARRVTHLKETCYHWRAVPQSAASSADAKPYAVDAGARAINEHFERTSFPGRVTAPSVGGVFQVTPALVDEPLVSIVIPTAGGSKQLRGVSTTLVTNAVRSVYERSTYRNFEVIVVADASVSEATRSELSKIGGDNLRFVEYRSAFNFSEKVNFGVVRSRGQYIVLLNDDVEVLPDQWRDHWPNMAGKSHWIESLLLYASKPGVGVSGQNFISMICASSMSVSCCTEASRPTRIEVFPRCTADTFPTPMRSAITSQ